MISPYGGVHILREIFIIFVFSKRVVFDHGCTTWRQGARIIHLVVHRQKVKTQLWRKRSKTRLVVDVFIGWFLEVVASDALPVVETDVYSHTDDHAHEESCAADDSKMDHCILTSVSHRRLFQDSSYKMKNQFTCFSMYFCYTSKIKN